jgi:zinc D-Ala-D-Ala carboxypeptidase
MILTTVILLTIGFLFLSTDTGIELTVEDEKKDNREEFNFSYEIKEPEDSTPIQPVQPSKPVVPPSTDKPSVKGWWIYPENIQITKRNGNDLLVLVNKEYRLPSTYAPSDLVKASNAGIRRGENYYLRNIVINDLRDMINAAKAEGIDISIISGYRSYNTQVNTYNNWLKKHNNNYDYVDTFSARPGHSEHQLGTTIDFSTNEINDRIGDSFANTKASNWLENNAYKYGFVMSYPKGYENITGYKYESWHYRYIGKSNALEMKNMNQILIQFLKSKN